MFSSRLIVCCALAVLAVAAPGPARNDIQQIVKAPNLPSKADVDSKAKVPAASVPAASAPAASVPAASAPAASTPAASAPAASIPAVSATAASVSAASAPAASVPVAATRAAAVPAATVPAATVPAATVRAATVPAATVRAATVPAATVPVVKVPPPKPVNEKFPHAVLFGGTCGGTIISPTWILTAGHCTLFTGGRYILAGTNNTENESGLTRHVKRQVIHPLFSVGPYWLDADEFHIKQVAARWDFLLAELSEPLPLDGKVMAAAKLDDQPSLPVGLKVGYAGYGTDHFGGTMRSEMHGMALAVQSDEVCSTLEQYKPKDMLCVKGLPPRFDSACNGDSGSGLVDETGRIIGVASWVENDAHDCSNGALVVFSRVSSVRDWIKQVTKV